MVVGSDWPDPTAAWSDARVITTVLFDFGGVFTPSPFAAARSGGSVLGHDPEVVIEIIFGKYDDDNDHPWHRLERGEVSLADARAQIMADARSRGFELDPFDALAGMASKEHDEEPFIERARRLRADGYRTGLITNNVAEFRDHWRKMVPVDELFEIVIDSCEVGMRKPDPRVFHLALDHFGAAPEATAFLDDFEGNIAAASALGLHGILVGDDRHAAVAALDDLLARYPLPKS